MEVIIFFLTSIISLIIGFFIGVILSYKSNEEYQEDYEKLSAKYYASLKKINYTHCCKSDSEKYCYCENCIPFTNHV